MTKQELRERKKDLSYVKGFGIDLYGISLLLAFKSLKSEVDVSGIVEEAVSKGIKVVFPHDNPFCFEDVVISEISCPALMLVPGLAFTPDGKRLGRGKGFYDRTLSVLPPCVKTIGICKKSQLLDSIPTEPHDMPVQQVMAF